MAKLLMRVVAGVAVSAFIGYCVYFDKKRRSPEYKKNHRKSKKSREDEAIPGERSISKPNAKLPGIVPLELEGSFMKLIHLGEMAILVGDFKRGLDHLEDALKMCSRPADLLEMMEEQLPRQFYDMLTKHLEASGRMPASKGA